MKRFAVILFSLIATNILAQTPVATVPFELYGEHLFIKLTVNNSTEELDFIFDTGDGLSVLSLETAERLDIKSDKKVKETSAGGRVTGYLVKHNTIHLDEIEIRNVKIYETSLKHLETAIGRKIDGIIGYDLLKNFVVEIDYNSMEFHIFDNSNYKYTGSGTPVKLKLKHAIPYVPGTVVLADGEILQGNFYLETGARTDLDFNSPFVKNNELESKVGDTYSYLVAGLSDHETEHTRGRIPRFSIAGFTFKNLPVGLSQESAGIQADTEMAGIVGNEILHRFNIVYDYKHHKMWWEENSKYEGPFFVNASGILLQLDKSLDKLLIHQIYDNSPAEKAGLMVDDEILEIGGKSAKELGLVGVRDLLAKSGETVTIKIKRKRETSEVSLTLADMI